MHQVRFPRRIQMGIRPYAGLSLRQLAYLIVAGLLAGGMVLFGPIAGDSLLMRALIGLVFIAIGVTLAFFRKDGLTVEQWLIARARYALRPQKRVWTRGGDSAPTGEWVKEPPTAEPRTVATPLSASLPLARPALAQAVVVFVDMAMLLGLGTLVVYLMRGGWREVQDAFTMLR